METKIINYTPLGNPKRRWRQDGFVISTFNGITKDARRGFITAREAGFNLIETGWAKEGVIDRVIPIAEETNTRLVIQDWRYFGGFQETRHTDIDEKKLKKFIRYTKKYKCIAGYYVWDEPYYPDDLTKAREQTDILEKADGGRLPFCVAIPSYNRAYTYKNGEFDGYLKRYCDIIEPPVLSLDFYDINNIKDCQLDKSEIYKDLYLMRKNAAEHNMPMWFYLQAVGDLDDMKGEIRSLEAKHIVMQSNLALLYGAKGLQYYLNYNSVVNYEDGGEGVYFKRVKALNRKILMWGRTLMALESKLVFHSPEVLDNDASFRKNYCDSIADSALLLDAPLPTRISAGEFEDKRGNKYLMVMNRDFDSGARFTLKLKDKFRIYRVNDTSGMQEPKGEANRLGLSIAPGEAALYRLQNINEKAFLIDYELKK